MDVVGRKYGSSSSSSSSATSRTGTFARPPEAPLFDSRLGAILQGRYSIRAQLATGAMSTVYRGERLGVGRPVAIKFLSPAVAAQEPFLEQFRNEVRALGRVYHPNCVSLVDFGVEGAPYVVMELVGGVSLRDTLNGSGGRKQPPRVLHLARQLLAGLAHVHMQGIVHRDVKPENLLVNNEPGFDDHLRIVDFGLAQLHDGAAASAGFAIGTPSYMAPEQCSREQITDERTDLYAVGVLLFEMLTGGKPFTSSVIGDIIRMHIEGPIPRLRELAPRAGLSESLEAVVARAMAKAPDDRHPTAAAFAAALDATPEGSARRERPPVVEHRAPLPRRPRSALPQRRTEPPPLWAMPPPLPIDVTGARALLGDSRARRGRPD
jgi:eukaryotic-like serine/threonine-protein kinase